MHTDGGQAIGVAGDCTDAAAAERLRQQAERQLGPAGVLAVFAGCGRARPGPVAEGPEEDWHSTVDGSLTATLQTIKSLLPGMIKRGRGTIVTMASSAARLPGPGAPAPYAAAQAGWSRSPARSPARSAAMACASTALRRTPSSPRRFSSGRPRSGGGRWPPRSRWGGLGSQDVTLAALLLASRAPPG